MTFRKKARLGPVSNLASGVFRLIVSGASDTPFGRLPPEAGRQDERYSSGPETVTWTANEPEFGGPPSAASLVLEPTAKLCPVALAVVLPPTGLGQPSSAGSIPHVLLIALGAGLTAVGASLLAAFSRGTQTREHPS